MGEPLTEYQLEQIRRLVRQELSEDETEALKQSIRPEQKTEMEVAVVREGMKTRGPNDAAGMALIAAGVVMAIVTVLILID